MDNEAAQRREDIKRKVAALIAKADATNFSEERDTFLAKADELMAVYAIQAFELEAAKDARTKTRKPEVRNIVYGSTGSHEADQELVQVFYSLVRMVGCQMGFWGWQNAKVVGYPEDLEYLEMLFLSIRLHLAFRLEPKPDASLSLELNLAMLKEAGLKWIRIHELLKKAGLMEDVPWERRIGVKFTGIYTKFCKETERPRMYSAPEVWRRNFIKGYCDHMQDRIYKMTSDRNRATSGKELVLASMKDEIMEVLYENFPSMRPHPEGCDCEIHHQCSDPNCQRPACVSRRTPVKFSNRARTVKEKVYDAAAARAGANAARTADLGSARGAPGGRTQELN